MNRIVIIVVLFAFGALGVQLAFNGSSSSTEDAAASATYLGSEEKAAATESDLPFRMPNIEPISLIDQAYAIIPHRRSKFDPTNPSILPSHREYLQQVFALIDQAVLWRVSGLQALARQDPNLFEWINAADRLIEGLDRIQPPREARRYHALIRETLILTRNFFDNQLKNYNPLILENLASDPILVRASQAARTAYRELQRICPARNTQAEAVFYDSHHALDTL